MKPKMKYSTNRISTAKQKNTASKALCFKLAKSQQKAKEVCHVYFMKLRSGLTIKKEASYFRRETTKRPSLKTGRKHKEHLVFTACQQQSTMKCFTFDISAVQKYTKALHAASIPGISPITESLTSLSTYNDQSIIFALEDESYEIYVEDLKKDEEKDKVLLSYYESQCSSNESGTCFLSSCPWTSDSKFFSFWTLRLAPVASQGVLGLWPQTEGHTVSLPGFEFSDLD
ncbi:interleukin-33 isoform X4 [Callithrix jacchus]|uniref:interleukin-33 isoform X5 n=1 Tax=Callithrix jacchus TaxID=9483 RepID=UPI00083F5C58|nr:interleukin-33 isoform X5 [Callithrix jacchus]